MLLHAKWRLLAGLLALCGWVYPSMADEVGKPVRVADSNADKFERKFPGTSHAHPGICVGRTGTVVIVHYVERAGLVPISRSTDGGQNWSTSQPVPGVDYKCYPGAISALGDSRLVVTWNGWLDPLDKGKGRRPLPLQVLGSVCPPRRPAASVKLNLLNLAMGAVETTRFASCFAKSAPPTAEIHWTPAVQTPKVESICPCRSLHGYGGRLNQPYAPRTRQ